MWSTGFPLSDINSITVSVLISLLPRNVMAIQRVRYILHMVLKLFLVVFLRLGLCDVYMIVQVMQVVFRMNDE